MQEPTNDQPEDKDPEVRPLRLQPDDEGAGPFIRLVAANGERLMHSEIYSSAHERDETLELIANTPIVIDREV